MRAALDASALGSGRGGDETFVSGVVEGLALAHGPGDEFLLVTRSGAMPPREAAADPAFRVQPVPVRRGVAWYADALPRALRQHARAAEVVLTVTHAPLRSPLPVVLTIGDLSFVHQPRTYPRATRLRLNTLVPRQIRAARAVVVPSEFSRDDLVATYGVAPDKVFVVPNRVRPAVPLSDAERGQAGLRLAGLGVAQRFVVYVGNLHPRKNVPLLIRAFGLARASSPELAQAQLVVAGARWWGRDDEQRAAAAVGNVVLTGRVDEVTRRLLLERALACAYVSTFEGFGLPPLEAMAAGLPVVASRTTAIPEVCAGAALLVDPLDVDEVAGALVRVCTDERERARLREAGLARAASYDAGRTGWAMLHALHCAATPGVPG